ncbi:MAG: alpha/beta fold hydrolase [Desulfobacteraceae bacterium]|jgi:pimeloyl-ACP methyl ester carboxylesterase
MPFVELEAEKIFYDRSPTGGRRVLLPIHGSGADHRSWPEGLRRLPAAAVFTPDLPGHGRSSGSGRSRVSDYADAVAAFAERLALENVVLMGHSLGGAIVLDLALRAPDWLAAIVLVGTGARLKVDPAILEGLLSDHEAAVERICQLAFGPRAAPALVERFRRGLQETPPTVTHGDYNACNRFDVMNRLGALNLPSLVVAGGADLLTPPKYGAYLRDHIPGAQMAVIPDAGHMMALESPEALVAHLMAFLEARLPPP